MEARYSVGVSNSLPGRLPIGELSRGYGVPNPGIRILGASGQSMLGKDPGNPHGEWFNGMQDESLRHASTAPQTQQLTTTVLHSVNGNPKIKQLYDEGVLAWIYGHIQSDSYLLPGGALQYPHDDRDYTPETRIVFGNRTVVNAYNLVRMQDEFQRAIPDPEEQGPMVGAWPVNVFRIAWPLAVETLLEPRRPYAHVTLAVGDSAQVKVCQTMEDTSLNAKRLFTGLPTISDADRFARRSLFSKLIPNGYGRYPPGTRLFAVLAAYTWHAGDGSQVQLETHVFADLTKDEITVLGTLVSQEPSALPEAVASRCRRENIDIATVPSCQVISPVVYIGTSTVSHHLNSGSAAIFTALRPMTLPTEEDSGIRDAAVLSVARRFIADQKLKVAL